MDGTAIVGPGAPKHDGPVIGRNRCAAFGKSLRNLLPFIVDGHRRLEYLREADATRDVHLIGGALGFACHSHFNDVRAHRHVYRAREVADHR